MHFCIVSHHILIARRHSSL